jgi:hypothetical protein
VTAAEIWARLEPVFLQEGVTLELLGESDERLFVRARRTGPGTPVAFLVKALEGTLRRYHEKLREVELVEYDPGEGPATPEQPSPEFEKVLKHRPPSQQLALPDIPGLDLRECDRRQAAQALEKAHKMWAAQGVERFRVRGLSQDPVRRAVEKWLSFYAAAEKVGEEESGDCWCLLVHGAHQRDFPSQDTLWFPARLMLL